jgi:integrase
MLAVRQQLVETKDGLRFGPPKTRSGERAVPLDALTVEILREHAARQTADRVSWGLGWRERGLVFTRENGDLLRPDYVTHLFARLALEAGLPRIRLHDLRHTSASLALTAGVPMKVVSERLGHSSTAITADLYTHVVPTAAREAADRIAATVPLRRMNGGQRTYSVSPAHSSAEPLTEGGE